MRIKVFALLALAVFGVAGAAQAANTCNVTSWNLASDWSPAYQYPDQANPVKDDCRRSVWFFQRYVPGTGHMVLDDYKYDYSWLGLAGQENWQPLGAEWCDGYYTTCTPCVTKNYNAFPLTNPVAGITLPGGAVALHPSPNHRAVVSWKSPFKGYVSIDATFTDIDPYGGDGVNYYVHQGKTQLSTGFIPAQGSAYTYANTRIPVSAGESLFFSIDAGNAGDLYYDSIQLDVAIQKVP